MRQPRKSTIRAPQAGFAALQAVCRRLKFEPHHIAQQLDARGHYELSLDKEFPFNIRLFYFSPKHYTPIWNWHERPELTMPLDGPLHMHRATCTSNSPPATCSWWMT